MNTAIPLGNYYVEVVLDDAHGGTVKHVITITMIEAPNRAPEFETELETSHTIVKTNEPGSWSYTLPATTDFDTIDTVTVSANIPAAA